MSLGVAVLSFAVVAGVLTVTPGLDTALVLRAALTGTRREALATAAGIVAGLLVWGVAAAAGISALVTASAVAYDVLRYAGAAYLGWLGARLLWRAWRPGSAWRSARTGLVTNLLNPKVGAFYLALLPQFLPAGTDPLLAGSLLAAVHGVLSMAWFALLTVLAGTLGRWLRGARARRGIDGVTGAALLAFGVRLALPVR